MLEGNGLRNEAPARFRFPRFKRFLMPEMPLPPCGGAHFAAHLGCDPETGNILLIARRMRVPAGSITFEWRRRKSTASVGGGSFARGSAHPSIIDARFCHRRWEVWHVASDEPTKV